jgi:RTX calcium-binding nonapeptide repeat (4 copies)
MRGRLVPLVLVALASPWMWPAAAEAAVARCDGHRATIVGTARGEIIKGTPGDDVIVGLQGNDIIRGRGGNDVICGNAGADRLLGGTGADQLFGGKDRISETDEETTRTGDVLRGGRGNDRLRPGRDTRPAEDISYDSISWDNSPHGLTIDLVSGIATGDGRDSFDARGAWVVGSKFADVINGSSRDDLIQGGPGSDVLRGRKGADRIIADESGSKGGDDRVWGGRGRDQLTSSAGQDVVRGGRGDDIIDDLGDSADLLYGGRGDDFLIGQIVDNGKPQGYWGGAGADQLSLLTTYLNPIAAPSTGTWDLSTGRLVIDVDGPLVVTAAGIQHGELSTYGTSWTVTGTDGADELSGAGTAGTTFAGLGGNDRFQGSASDDTFAGGPGVDHSLGMGVGDDTCTSVEVFDAPDCEHVTP